MVHRLAGSKPELQLVDSSVLSGLPLDADGRCIHFATALILRMQRSYPHKSRLDVSTYLKKGFDCNNVSLRFV